MALSLKIAGEGQAKPSRWTLLSFSTTIPLTITLAGSGVVASLGARFREFPPRQNLGFFSLDQALEGLQNRLKATGH